MLRLTAFFLLAGVTCAHAQINSSFGPLTKDQAVFASLNKRLLGVWALVTPRMTRRIDTGKLNAALRKCGEVIQPNLVTHPALTEAKRQNGGLKPTDLRGDLVFYNADNKLRRLDFSGPTLAEATRWAEKSNAKGEPIFGVQYGGRTFPYYFNKFGVAPANSGFVLEGQALYLKCPPIPGQQ